MNIDNELKSALKRVEPPIGFADRVMLKLEPEMTQRHSEHAPFWKWLLPLVSLQSVRWAAAVALVLLIAGGAGVRYLEQRREAAQAEAAKEKLLLALGVASEKINLAQRKVMEIGKQPKENESRGSGQNRTEPRIRKRQTSQASRAVADLFAALRITSSRIEEVQTRLSHLPQNNTVENE